MMVGAAEDVVKAQDYAFAKAEMDKLKLAGFDSIRITQTWTKGQTKLGPNDAITLGNAMQAAQFTGVRVILSLYPFGSSVTPLTDQERLDFTQFAADVAQRYPLVHDFIIGNEPNLNRFWLPQFGPNGEDVAAPGYEQLLAATYDALKVVRPHSTIYGGALAPRGVDKPNTGRDTHSPTTFIADLGAAYKASGRLIPIMDAFAFHPYPENSATGPNFPHPNSTAIGLADYPKLVGLLGAAFDGTAQKGSTLPILYDEFGIESQIPAAKAPLYTGTEPATTKPVDETVQAQMYLQSMQMTFCQPTVMGLLLFHVQDEPPLSAWQSGEYYVDGTPKTSLYPVRSAAFGVHRGIVAACPGLLLTPKLVITTGKPDKTGVKVFLTCSLDCNYTVSLDNRSLTGLAVGRTPKPILFKGALPTGLHRITAQGTVPTNTGPAGTVSKSFRSR
ncbi:MAG: polysaccharide biosynthesis protein PslG [Gaiellaceae bacterium]|nr:polysaccharide biosynthesis protein PslG [Gaiellaceae bacterium]